MSRGDHRPACRRDDRGFTLLEVVVALAVTAIAVSGVMYAFSTATRLAAGVADRETARRHAESLIDRLGVDTPLVEGVSRGRIDRRFSFRVEARANRAASAGAPTLSALEVRVTVGWRDGSAPRALALSTIKLRTAGAPGA